MAETETEFGIYTGDCVWNAAHMAFHRLDPTGWPLPDLPTLDRLTSEAISAGIGVGSQGQADPSQLEYMLTHWGVTYQVAYAYNGVPIPPDTLRTLLDNNVSPPTNKPVMLGFTNGQALTGDEVGLHGHEIVVLHPYDPTNDGYGCGDGDSQAARAGQLSYYNLDVLTAAQPDSAYVLLEVPPNMISITTPGVSVYFTEQQKNGVTVWTCHQTGFDISGGLLSAYQSWPASGSLNGLTAWGLPTSNSAYQNPPAGKSAAYVQRFERGVAIYDPDRWMDTPPGAVGPVYVGHAYIPTPAPPEDNAGIILLAQTIQSHSDAIHQEAAAIISKAGG